eukprot:254210_1
MTLLFGIIIFLRYVSSQQENPNVLFLLIDDLGWANIGFHNPVNSEVKTPNIDYLANQGVILDRHYVHYVCCPSRTSFQTGRIPVHVNIENCITPTHVDSGIPQNMTALGTKMKLAGFNTYFYGKWHVGMATYDHTPKGRGYDTSLIYFQATVDYYSRTGTICKKQDNNLYKDLWQGNNKYNGPAYQYNTSIQYIDSIFSQHILDTLDKSINSTKPFFMVYSAHTIHAPLQVPKQWLTNFDNDEDKCSQNQVYDYGIYPGGPNKTQPDLFHCRSIYISMTKYIDSVIGNITQKLKDTGMWNNTLIVFSSDNGGECSLGGGAANNSPLRGGKHSIWEGGIRAATYISGGWNGIPNHRRGLTENGMMHISDWYTTFCRMFGVDPFDKKAADNGLPLVDGYNMWPLITGQNSTSPRILLPIDNTTLISDNYKLIISQELIPWACWEGNVFPNSSSPNNPPSACKVNCSMGCLFDVVNDYTEHIDLATNNMEIVKQMNETLNQLRHGYFVNNDQLIPSCPMNVSFNDCGCWFAENYWDGYFGPFCNINSTNEVLI